MKHFLKNLLATLFFCILLCSISAQVKTKTFADSIPTHLLPLKNFYDRSILLEPPPEFYKLKKEAEINTMVKGWDKVALPSSVNIDLLKKLL